MNRGFLVLSVLLSTVIAAEWAAAPDLDPARDAPQPDYPRLPQALASFGAAVEGDWLYVYGGHVGKTHQHSLENLAHTFRRLDLEDGESWQELGPVPGLQGLALVSHGGRLYRVGGLTARNHRGEAEDLHSVADFERYDPGSGAWEPLPSLPEPRSSHDAAFHDGELYVVGGWRLGGAPGEGEWHRSAWVIDLESEPLEWRPLPEPPFLRRALAVAAAGGKVYALGGLSPEGTSNSTFVYDVAAGAWSEGPALPLFEGMKGFGASAFGVGGALYVSSLEGLYRLRADGAAWIRTRDQPAKRRFFHRLLPRGPNGLLLVGGASRDGHLDDVESLEGPALEPAPEPALATEAAAGVDPARQWSGFRGHGDGRATGEAPLEWSESENLDWRIDLPGYGQSSPVVWGRQVFVTSAEGPRKEVLIVSAIDLADGTVRWRRRFPASQKIEASESVSRSAPTPAVDSKRLYVFFESGDLAALDHDGGELWRRSLSAEYGALEGNHGVAGSPVLTGSGGVVLVDHEGPSYLLSFDPATGENRWKVDRPGNVSWSSPIVSSFEGIEEVLVSAAGTLESYDADTGKRVWYVEGIAKNRVPSPAVAGDLVVVGSSENGNSLAVRRGGRGDVTATHVAWRAEDAASGFASPLVHGGCAYFVNRAGVLRCVDVETGETSWSLRLADSCWASPIAVAERAYFFSKDGTTTVVESHPEGPRKLAESVLPAADPVYGVAAADGAFLIRTGTKLARVSRHE